MKYTAVIFDLFGTLVNSTSIEEHEGVMAEIASVLSVPADDFGRLWLDTSYERVTGTFQSNEANIEYVCRRLGVPPVNTQTRLATEIIADSTTRLMKNLRADAIEVLSQLKSEGYKTGLISDCSPAVPLTWKETPLSPLIDVAVFSCSVGLQKPDLRIYQLATQQLAVEPEHCLYVGDGSSQELTGASQVGMHPVLIRVPDEESTNPYRINAEEWDGPAISSLREVLDLVD